MVKLIDTHCHFDFPPFIEDLDRSLEKLETNHVEKIIIPAVDIHSSQRIIKLISTYDCLFGAIGCHPIYQHHLSALDELATLLSNSANKLVAVGEIGLDNYQSAMTMAEQQWYLDGQIQLANQHQLPIILHSRRTHSQIYKQLKATDRLRQGVLHGFSGSYEEAMQFIKLGYYIGVGGVITYPRANKTREAIRKIPIESIVLETDAPDMPLNGFQGEPNRPERLPIILTKLAELRGESASLLSEQIYQNTQNLFPKLNLK